MFNAYGQHIPDYPGQQPWSDPAYYRHNQQFQQPYPTQGQTVQQPSQPLTPPTIHAEIVQVDGEADVERWPVNAGASQMFITRDETQIIVKTMGANGPLPLDVYVKRPPAPVAPPFNPAEYVRRDELPELIAAVAATPKRTPKKEVANDEPV